MSRRVMQVWCGAVGLLLINLLLPMLLPHAEAQQPRQPLWTHAFNLKCRKFGQDKFNDARAFGMEVFRDDNNGAGLYVIETGAVAATKTFDIKAVVKESKAPEWMHGLDLKYRKAGQEKFDEKQAYGLEIFRDENSGNWIYISENGHIAVAAASGASRPSTSPKAPTWTHGLDLKVRKAKDKIFDKDTKVWSVEVFRDENNGNLIYLCETGSIAIVPGFESLKIEKSLAPAWFHGLDLKCRIGGKKEFEPNTPIYGLEVFRDENTGNWIYLTENGKIAVLPGNKTLKAPTVNPSEPRWTHGLDLKCRKFDEKDFGPKTKIWGIEVFNDANTGCTIYICETGTITAVPIK
jgi:hypothetical protein